MTLYNDDGTEMTAAQLEAQITALKAELVYARRRTELSCPLCGGALTASTKFKRLFCRQDYGACGIFLLRHKSRSPWTVADFIRTTVEDGGKLREWQELDPKSTLVKKYYIGDREVSKEEYDGKSKSSDLEVAR